MAASRLWSSVGSTLQEQIKRHDAVIHLRTPLPGQGYNRENPLRIESAEEAAAVDARIAAAWESHSRRFIVESTADFLAKAQRALALLREQMPECCRRHLVPSLDLPRPNAVTAPASG